METSLLAKPKSIFWPPETDLSRENSTGVLSPRFKACIGECEPLCIGFTMGMYFLSVCVNVTQG